MVWLWGVWPLHTSHKLHGQIGLSCSVSLLLSTPGSRRRLDRALAVEAQEGPGYLAAQLANFAVRTIPRSNHGKGAHGIFRQ